jgi:hypothetical protein
MNAETNQKLVGAKALLESLWPDEKDRPSIRWLRYQQKSRTIPYVKMGHRVWFDPIQVRAAVATRFTINPK